ncbi:cell division topological specificity factor MinE [Phormidium sp. LEGE 05292]|uniref:cell division topological specificity factor MinE n=1 Tax=[Phormidium] sp. LEGE 05292 TaxID=767427 RepID=UPI00187EC9B1|nr:cell division topological specificity factor MinE [Phormidium sp. LEGE 05292]MBE9225122.1 cell division topological specificity factor MinE [Phormidium sp. LEGE 05292]
MFNEFLEKLFSWKSDNNSRDQVKRRLKLVLGHDRTGLSPQDLEEMRKEIVEVISRYVELDTEELVFSIENNERSSALIANLPIRRVKNEEKSEQVENEENLENEVKEIQLENEEKIENEVKEIQTENEEKIENEVKEIQTENDN